ncbi:MAG TPA: hypothetical protein VMG41_02610 [Gemmatimonadales bacterium]|nr:hypothetical protein [Gemmatimonadales bacterium]
MPLLLVAACAIAACETNPVSLSGTLGGGGGGSTGVGPTVSQQKELMLAVEDEIEATVTALTLSAPGVPPGFVAAGCPGAISNPADNDHDGIPNNGSFSFTNPPCAGPFRGDSLTVTGSLGIVDASNADSVSYSLTYNNLAWAVTDTGGRSYTAIRTGTRQRTAVRNSLKRDTTASLVNSSVTIIRVRPGMDTATVIAGESAVLTGGNVASDTIGVKQNPPVGSLTFGGTLTWSRDTEAWSLQMATPSALHYNPVCVLTPQRVDSGTVTLTGTVGGQAGVLTLKFTACARDPGYTWAKSP